MNSVLSKYSSLVPVNDENTTNRMMADMIALSPAEQHRRVIQSADVGYILVFTNDKYPNKILEYVKGSQEDSVSTLYGGHPIFNSLQSLIDARKEIIFEIGAVIGQLPSTIKVFDEGRKRHAHLYELGTAQLYDILESVYSEGWVRNE